MKKLLVIVAAALFASMVQAEDYYWNVKWLISGALSPTADPNDMVPVLQDYSVTWSLMNGSTGTAIEEYNVAKGTGSTSDTWFGHGKFDDYLIANGDATFQKLEETIRGEQSLYQRVYIYNDTEAYEWISDTILVEPTKDLMGSTPTIPGDSLVLGMDVDWSPAELPTDVPEPATMSLLGLGALAMVLRRKLRK